MNLCQIFHNVNSVIYTYGTTVKVYSYTFQPFLPISVKPAGVKRDIAVTIFLRCMCVQACVLACVCPDDLCGP